MWLKSWAYATSPAPYGLGMLTAESWALTPREFTHRAEIMRQYLEAQSNRWMIERIERLNAPHFSKKNKQPYTLEDFGGAVSDRPLDGADAARMRARKLAGLPEKGGDPERDKVDLMMEKTRDARLAKLMKSGNFDDSILPKWARMTDQEKRDRGIN